MLPHPPFSPGLAPAFLLFPKLKTEMEGERYRAVSLNQQTVMRELKAIQEESFSWTFS
jgi:hypothetical protein